MVLADAEDPIGLIVETSQYSWSDASLYVPSQKFQLMKHQLEVAAVYSRQVALYSSLAARVMAIVMN